MEIIKGNLDNISRPASGEQTGSRVSSASLAHHDRLSPPSPFALVVLTSGDTEVMNRSVDESNTYEYSGHSDADVAEQEGKSNLLSAIEEMRRLDALLSTEMLNAKQIRRQRLEARANLWQELEENKPKGYKECMREAVNTRLFLALDPPCFGPKGDDYLESMFQTQCLYPDNSGTKHQSTKRQSGSPELLDVAQEVTEQEKSEDSSMEKPTDFVRRNIKLASVGRGEVFMTQRQRDRLAVLLREIDEEEEDSARGADNEQNKWAESVPTGHGYTPEPSDLQQLIEIDSKIRMLFPAEEFHSLQSSYTNLSISQASVLGLGRLLDMSSASVCETGWRCDGDMQPAKMALQDMNEWRGQERRLHEIQQQLEMLDQGQDMTDKSPELTEDELRILLNQCELAQSWRIEDMDTSCMSPQDGLS